QLGERALNKGGAWFALERVEDEPLELIASRLEVLGPVTEGQPDVPDAAIAPVSAADFLRFLFHWQHVAGEDQMQGVEGLAAVIEQLEGYELAAAGWENDVLPARVANYG